MDIFTITCQEIDSLYSNVTNAFKENQQKIIIQYQEILEEENFTNFNDCLTKFLGKIPWIDIIFKWEIKQLLFQKRNKLSAMLKQSN